jgi:hypothetical protein
MGSDCNCGRAGRGGVGLRLAAGYEHAGEGAKGARQAGGKSTKDHA